MKASESTNNNKKRFKQYFTPPRVAAFMLDMLALMGHRRTGEPVSFVDPACGEGVFIRTALERGLTDPFCCRGVDRDTSLAEMWNDEFSEEWQRCFSVRDSLFTEEPRRFQLAVGNPPYGILPLDPENLHRYGAFELFRSMSTGKKGENLKSFPVEVFFIERFLHLLEPGGAAAIVLPQGIFTNEKMGYIRNWLADVCTVRAIVFMMKKVFTSEGAAVNTALLFFENMKPQAGNRVFWGSASKIELEGNKRDHLDELLTIFDKEMHSSEEFDRERSEIPLSVVGRQESVSSTQLITESADVHTGFSKEVHEKTSQDLTAFFTPNEILKETRWDSEFNHPRYRKSFDILKSSRFKTVPLGNIIFDDDIVTGYKGPQEQARTQDRIPFITSRHVTPSGIDMTGSLSFIDRESPPDSPRSRLQTGDLLLVRSGEGCIGRTAVVTPDWKGANIRSEIYILRIDREILNPYYLMLFLRTFPVSLRSGRVRNVHSTHFQTARLANGVGTPNLNKQEILSLLIPVIPMKEQDRFEAEFREIEEEHRTIAGERTAGLREAEDPERVKRLHEKVATLVGKVEGMFIRISDIVPNAK